MMSSVMYPEFQIWASLPMISEKKWGDTLQNLGSMIFVRRHFVESEINRTLNMGGI